MNTTWILVADGGRARLIELQEEQKRLRSLKTIRRFVHRIEPRADGSNPPGRVRTGLYSPNLTALGPHSSRKEAEALKFARRLNETIVAGYNDRKFDRLAIIAPPHFLGVLHKTLDDSLSEMIVASLTKDCAHVSAEHLTDTFCSLLKIQSSKGKPWRKRAAV